MLFLTLILLGYSFVEIIDYKLYINDISRIGNDPECYFARLSECPSVNEKSLKVTLNVFAFAENQEIAEKIVDALKNFDVETAITTTVRRKEI